MAREVLGFDEDDIPLITKIIRRGIDSFTPTEVSEVGNETLDSLLEWCQGMEDYWYGSRGEIEGPDAESL